jgi:hypothetical protein
MKPQDVDLVAFVVLRDPAAVAGGAIQTTLRPRLYRAQTADRSFDPAKIP